MSNEKRVGYEDIPDFVPIKRELLQLVNFWVKKDLDRAFFEFMCATYAGSTLSFSAYAWSRIDRIGELLGEESVKKAVEEAYAEFGKDKNQRHWEIFMHGSSEDRKALQDEFQREITSGVKRREDRELWQRRVD